MKSLKVPIWFLAAVTAVIACQAQTRTIVLANTNSAAMTTNIVVGTNEIFELLHVRRYPYSVELDGVVNIGSTSVTNIYIAGLTWGVEQGTVIAGPATVSFEWWTATPGKSQPLFLTYRTTKQVDTFVANTGVVIPADAGGPVSVLLETSTNFVSWTQAQPGTYGVSSSERYFRLRAVRN